MKKLSCTESKNNKNKLAKEQRKVSKKVKLSSNWHKQKKKITQLYSKIVNMSKSAKGTIEHKSKNVKAKSGLNKSILDQGWYEFARQFEYKSTWYGGEVIRVTPRYTSQTCSNCGYKDSDNRLSQAKF
ncbi:RNA-guided endonuclease InsQ/TnpB family protein [Francisella sp. SYW-2]|uniref:RNA-guided endonuclease InsQ/TnpB family protein n=1 Tax=Francisella sp. SYW-2 TaxID=2610886 RepID=UPI00123E3A06|nr:zinc ribbon domain-containing protein [Francisella sp. SYW-2]